MSNPLDAVNPLDPVKTVRTVFYGCAPLSSHATSGCLIDAQSRARVASKPSANVSISQEEEHDPHYEPVIRLTDKDQVEVKTHEEDEDVKFKMCV